jgi:serine/threonine protein phosphatase PrpC
MPLLSSGLCNIGQKRKKNQDSIYLNPEKNIFIVADGMGGHNGGEVASAMAVEHIPEYILSHPDDDPVKLSRDSIQFANNNIKKRGEADPELVGMGTTVVSFLFKGVSLYVGNVGDSRAYLINDHRLFQLSRDHSLVQEKLNYGIYTREQAQADPQKNVLVRTVGFEEEVEIDIFTYKVSKNDIFLSCSDGLHGKVSDQDIIYIVNKCIPDPSKATKEDLDNTAQQLVDQANANGGNDNISAVLVLAQ